MIDGAGEGTCRAALRAPLPASLRSAREAPLGPRALSGFKSPGVSSEMKKASQLGGHSGLMVRAKGLEPPRDCSHTDLNRTRLPIPPRPRKSGFYY